MIFIEKENNINFNCNHGCVGGCFINLYRNYDVKLWGSWDNWTNPITAKYIESDYVRLDRVDYHDIPANYKYKMERFLASVPSNLTDGIYEYKWQFTNKTTKNTFWITNSKKKMRFNDGWNCNNLFIVTKSKGMSK